MFVSDKDLFARFYKRYTSFMSFDNSKRWKLQFNFNLSDGSKLERQWINECFDASQYGYFTYKVVAIKKQGGLSNKSKVIYVTFEMTKKTRRFLKDYSCYQFL